MKKLLLEFMKLKNYRLRNFEKKYPFISNYIIEGTNFLNTESMIERIYHYSNDIKNIPKCNNENCNNFVKYNGKGMYRKYCSNKCHMTSNQTKEKRKQTILKQHGVDNISKVPDTIEKIKNTKLEKYNDPNFNNMEKNKATKLEKYGDQFYCNSKKIKKSRHKNTFQNFKRFANKIKPLFQIDEYDGGGYSKLYEWICIDCNTKFKHWYHNGVIPHCPNCNRNSIEQKIINFLNFYDLTIQSNSYSIIKNLQIDVYIPEKNIGIEFNGNFWHSELSGNKNKNYHLNKTKLCEEKSIQLIHIFEDEWEYKQQIVKNRLRHILGLTKYKIYGRKCVIREISTKLKNNFLNKYHIQGEDKSRIKLGAFYKNRLIAVMTFGYSRFDKKKRFELIRFCTVGNFRIIGIAGKLLKHFERNYNKENLSIISYADRRWSIGKLYESLGFKNIRSSSPNYFYQNKDNYLLRLNRMNFQKHKLENKLKIFNPELSEWENMQLNGYDRIWDCGNLVYIK